MKPKESLEDREKMAKMHNAVLERIDKAIKNKSYFEACWLCYACFESRLQRIMDKLVCVCPKADRKDGRFVGIATKIECLTRLAKNGYLDMSKEDTDALNSIKGWCKRRNDLTHGLVTIEKYDASEKEFASLAKSGKTLVSRAYQLATKIREQYYEKDAFPQFPDNISGCCRLKSKCQTR